MAKRYDLAGQRFGRWTVVELSGRDKSGNSTWLCQCDCGKTAIVVGYSLTRGNSKSCGCHRRATSTKTHIIGKYKENLRTFISKDCVDGTRISTMKHGLRSDNTSGHAGVAWDKTTARWVARITFSGKNIHLGRFEELHDAIAARKAAEEKYFKPLLERFDKNGNSTT